MKILILNSDSPHNRGDRAILCGVIKLVRNYFPQAEIWGISEITERDEKWFGIKFLSIPVQSLNLSDLLKLLRLAKNCDIILWGGGEMLKDYTNRLGLLYWTLKIFLVSLVNSNIFGIFQGIGATNNKLSQRMITSAVNKTKLFITRDEESQARLINWGCKDKVITSYDPAILEDAKPLSQDILKRLKDCHNIDRHTLNNFIGLSPRNWFHYKTGRWLPVRYKKKLFGEESLARKKSQLMFKNLATLVDWIIEEYQVKIIFFPMHMSKSEADIQVCYRIVEFMKYYNQVKVLDQDIFSPNEYLNIISQAKLFIGSRLHANILSTVTGVPSMGFYYVEKGRSYFQQIKCDQYSFPIIDILQEENLTIFKDTIGQLWDKREQISDKIKDNILKMRAKVYKDFELLTKKVA